MDALNDVFISYSHNDKEWVTNLDHELRRHLQKRLGCPPKVWRDPNLTGNEKFGDRIERELEHSQALVSVLSSRYVQSDWCRKELETFYELARQRGDLYVDTKARIFKAVMLPPEPDDPKLPPPLSEWFNEVLDYKFYRTDAENNRVRELCSDFGEQWRVEFCKRADDLADDINKLLRALRGQKLAEKLTVYLAAAGPDPELSAQRDEVQRELNAQGFRVLPETCLPTSVVQLEKMVMADLERCACSIHLVGAHPEFIPAGAERSVDELQHDWAIKRAERGRFLRLIWMPKTAGPPAPRRLAFMKALREDPQWQANAEAAEGSLDLFKRLLLDKLRELEKPGQTIFLAEVTSDLAEPRDRLRERLLQNGYVVLPPEPLPLVYEAVASQVRTHLRKCNFSLHILGAKYGCIPEDAEQSIPEIQYQLAGERCGNLQLARLVLLPQTVPSPDRRQAAFLSTIHQSSRLATQLVQEPLDRIESAVLQELARPREVPSSRLVASTSAKSIYLVCHECDVPAAAIVAKLLSQEGFEILYPDFETAAKEALHQKNLCDCDGVLIYWGQSSLPWLRKQQSDLLRAPGLGRRKALAARAILLGPPDTPNKRMFTTTSETILVSQSGGALLDLSAFLARVP